MLDQEVDEVDIDTLKRGYVDYDAYLGGGRSKGSGGCSKGGEDSELHVVVTIFVLIVNYEKKRC